MPVPSAFTPCGALRCSSAPSHIETFYKMLPTMWGSELDFSVGTEYNEPHLYAAARMLALALGELEHAGNQAYPARCYDLLPLLELDFGLIPGPRDSVTTRQAALAAAELFPRGEIASNVTNSLRAIFGSAFLAYVPAPGSSSNNISAGLYTDVRVAPRLVQLTDPVVKAGSAWVGYQNFDLTIATPIALFPGDRVMVGAGNTATQEIVTVADVSTSAQAGAFAGAPGYFSATFARPHAVGDAVRAGNWPYWWAMTRTSLVVVSAAAAAGAAERAQASALLATIARGVEQFFIVAAATTTSTGGTVGPLEVGGPMGAATVGSISFTNSL